MVDIYALFMAHNYHNEKRKLKTVALFISVALSGTTGSAYKNRVLFLTGL
jgi:hypothetical protein